NRTLNRPLPLRRRIQKRQRRTNCPQQRHPHQRSSQSPASPRYCRPTHHHRRNHLQLQPRPRIRIQARKLHRRQHRPQRRQNSHHHEHPKHHLCRPNSRQSRRLLVRSHRIHRPPRRPPPQSPHKSNE